jgi:membrane associated rhomboid family serine protease
MFGLLTPPWTRGELLFAGGYVLLLLLLGISDGAREWLRYDRELITAGEFWRWFSGNFVHLGTGHLLLDGLGLMLLLLFSAMCFRRATGRLPRLPERWRSVQGFGT